MNDAQQTLINILDNKGADEALVAVASRAMTQKLEQKRSEGRGNWHTKTHGCTNDKLLVMLREHVKKGDMVDVLNLAAMIHVRSELYGKRA